MSGAGAGAGELTALLLSPWALGVLGLLIGSFLNVVVHRLPASYMREWWGFDIADFALSDARSWRAAFGAKAQPPAAFAAAAAAITRQVESEAPLSLWRPRSRCPHCGHTLGMHENVPVLSWLWLRGRCSACKAPISTRYPLVELLTAGLFAACAARYGAQPFTVVACAAAALLVAMALIDLDFTLLPDGLTIPLVVMALIAAAAGVGAVPWARAAAGALIGYGVLWGLGAFWHIVLRKPNAMAEGDMKMLAGIGALLGAQAIPGVLMLSAGLGAVVGVTLIALRKHDRERPIPFGPYLALGGLAGLLFPAAVNGFGESISLALGPF